jgi:hypothetical protein
MFHEEFVLNPKEEDPAGEYVEESGVIKYYMPHIYTDEALIETIDHEWLHALFQWADEENWTVDGDHFIMRELGF